MTVEDPRPPADDGPVRTAPAEADRAISPIAGRFGGQRRWISLAALAAGCGVFLLATWDRDGAAKPPAEPDAPARQLVPFEPARREPPPRLADAATDPLAPGLGGEPGPEVPALEPRTAGPGPAPADPRRTLLESAQRAPVLAYSRPALSAPTLTGPAAALASPPAASPTPLDALRQAGPIGRAQAGRLPDRNLLLVAGAALPCVLQTAMDSSTPGYVSCVVPKDIYSDNGAVVLMERGTRVLGEYRGGLQRGRSRLFVLWTRAVTPTGVTVTLASPAADALGRAGFDGEVDTHFWQRFGGALLLSVVDDGVHAAVGEDGPAGTTRLPSDAAGVALQASVGIPPTLRKAQGAEVSIFVAQDLDFSRVYRLRAR
ncbi:type IV secretion system protein VirB10 [Brevundimonas sp. A19_0]|uniref:type IV secretion system protein VirB10 n=1 Tax=Brevundimonas sp. A19_0 TaxID=2821087 RepID=UPI001ADBF4B4|nr:type IV secretion system protein VirB10 [Brevundimonas sp. A19_0]MBO9501621.1 type IV secretion system protein VirB10 [Brevundimonas sp. A19_0]